MCSSDLELLHHALLGITLKTAEFHRGRVMKKLDVHDVAGLVRYAIREGLITP